MARYAPAPMISECNYSALPEWIEERSSKEISQGAKICFARLLGYARSNGYAFPPIKQLAKNIGVNHKQARRYIHQLEDLGLIEIEYRNAEPSRFYLIDDYEWFPKDLKILRVSPKKPKKESKKLSTGLDTYDQGGVDICDQKARHIRGGGLDTCDQGSSHICLDINKNKQLTTKLTNNKQPKRGRAKGGDFDLFEDAGLNSRDENLHFSSAIATYPKNPHHRNLYSIQKLWIERRIDGFTSKQLALGVKAYREYCDGRNITDTQMVMSLGRFFGAEFNFNNSWADELERHKKESNPYSRYEFHKAE